MAGGFPIFAPAYTLIDGKLDDYLTNGVANIVAVVEEPLRAALVLYVMLYGFAILRGAISEPIMDFAIRSLKLALIYMLATTVAYSDWVTQPLFHVLPDTLAQGISGTTGGDAGTSFDQFFSRAAYLGEKAGQEGSPVNPLPWLMQLVVVFIGGVAAGIGFGVVLIAKVALALIIALGPIFVACALFDATRRYFFGWLSQAVNYLILFALILAVLQLILLLVASLWASIDGQDPMVGCVAFILLSILGAIFFLQTPAIAAGVAGGASAGLADFANAGSALMPKPMPAGPPRASAPAQAPRPGSVQPAGTR